MPAFIYFDLGNVLLTFSHRQAARQVAAVAGADEEEVFRIIFEEGLEARVETGELTSREFYEVFCQETSTRADYRQLQKAGNAIFAVNTPMLPMIAHLKAAGHRLGLLSNTSESHWEYIAGDRYAFIGSFELTVLSYEVGLMKPDPKIYEVAAARAGVPPQDIFFTDDRQENVEGARRAGWDAVPFTTAAALAKDLRNRGVAMNY